MDLLVKNWELIRDEGLEQIRNGPLLDHTSESHNDTKLDRGFYGWVKGWSGNPNWLNYGFVYNSKFMKKNCLQCPNTFKLLKKIKNKEKLFLVGFSLLKGRTTIPTHTDENKDATERKIFHIGLSIPDPKKCILIVNKKIYNQKNGKILTFDDRLPHSALNSSREDRLILYIKI
jgi:aspartyl/asparaginyl beta-hydroxylase (cupin superfamily)